jgi:3-oxoacyl-[acyl-carrier protein] reductase
MSKQVAIVTGGSRGIGKACVLALAKAGFDVTFTYASNQGAAQEVASAVEALGQKALPLQADAASNDAAQRVIDQTLETFGQVDALVNNAGITADGLIIRLKDDDWDKVIATNLTGAFYMLRAASKVMMKQRMGRIVNITSIVGVHGNAGQTNYAASKAGLIGVTKSAAKELASRNITVNAVAPGFIQTDMTENLNHDKILAHIPLGRLGEGQDIASAVVFLVTSGGYITGQVLQVDGGLVL